MIISASYFLELIKKEKRLSEGVIPELIKKLIRNTVNDNTKIHFPSNDDIFTPGWDGCISNVSIKHRFIPTGNSIFELGAKKNTSRGLEKIKSDYYTRKKEEIKDINKKEYTYIAVTTSIISTTSKQTLTKKLSEDNVFKKVEIIDANDIVDWLNDHVDICIWFLKQYDIPLKEYDISLVDDEWNYIANSTIPSLKTDIFINGNEGISQKIIEDLQTSSINRIFCISSKFYGRVYSYYFCVATLMNAPISIKERCITVNSQEGLNFVNGFSKGKIVLVNFNCTDERFSVDLKNTYIFFDSCFNDDIQLNSVTQSGFIEEVKKLGFDDSEARRLSFNVDYNVLAFRRLMAKTPNIKKPSWAREKDKNQLIPLLLMGEIDVSNKGDVIVLKELVGDNYDLYIELLNYWSEYPESPIFKYDSIYRICARKECFDYLQVDVHSIKIQKLAEFIKNIYRVIDSKYNNDTSNCFIKGKSTYREKLIINILNGFIILADRNKNNKLYFDNFVYELLLSIKGDYRLYLSISDVLYYLSELSYSSILSFFKTALKEDKDEFIKYIDFKEEGYFSSKRVNSVLYALNNCFSEKNTVYEAITWLLDLYIIYNDKSVLEKLLSVMSPISCMEGFTYLSLNQITSFFFSYIKDKDSKLFIPIVKQLQSGGNMSIMISDNYSYRRKTFNKKTVMYSEIYEMQSEALRWLLLDDEDDTKITALVNVLHNMHTMPFESISKDIDAFSKCATNFDDETKRKARREILKTIENIKKFPEWKYLSKYISKLSSIADLMIPNDLYNASKDILFTDNFPIDNPIPLSNEDKYKIERNIRIKEKEKIVGLLIDKYGQDVIKKIIQEENNHSLDIWTVIYDSSNDHNRDVSWMLLYKNDVALRQYFRMLPYESLVHIYETNYDNELIIRNMPYCYNVMKLLEGNKLENIYWENQYFYVEEDVEYKYVYNKFIKYDPFKLVPVFAYRMEPSYEDVIFLLKTLASPLNQEYLLDNIKKNPYDFQELINKTDSKYYTEELSQIEFSFLSYLLSTNDDYPLGIKRYFWNNPQALSNLLIDLYKNKDSLKQNTIGFKMYFQVIFSFGDCCYIPREYLTQKANKVPNWVAVFHKSTNGCDSEICEYLDRALLITLSSCVKNQPLSVWPSIEIADAIEMISKDFEDSIEAARIFSIAYYNRKGLRSITDGEPEIAIGNEFIRFRDFYFPTHPITSKALEMIANDYYFEGEKDKKRSIIGE